MIEESDNILIASPIYFGQLTGPLISLGSRLQAYYCAEAFQNRPLLKRIKKGQFFWLAAVMASVTVPGVQHRFF